MKIGFLGPKGSFSHHVAQEAFPADTLVAFENITEVRLRAVFTRLWIIFFIRLPFML